MPSLNLGFQQLSLASHPIRLMCLGQRPRTTATAICRANTSRLLLLLTVCEVVSRPALFENFICGSYPPSRLFM